MCLRALIVLFCFFGLFSQIAYAADTWLYTNEAGDEYYLRGQDRTRSWSCAYVVMVSQENITYLIFQFEYFFNEPYNIYYGTSMAHPGKLLEKGCIHGGGYVNPVAKVIYEKYGI